MARISYTTTGSFPTPVGGLRIGASGVPLTSLDCTPTPSSLWAITRRYFREFLEQGTFLERKAPIRNFVKGIEVMGDGASAGSGCEGMCSSLRASIRTHSRYW